jgi:hypothetical protein
MAATALGGLWQAMAKLPSAPAPQAMSFAGIIPGASILTSLLSWLAGTAAVAALVWGTVAYLKHKGKAEYMAQVEKDIAAFNSKERALSTDERVLREQWEEDRRKQAEQVAINRGFAIAKDGTHYIPDDVVDQINRIKRRVR